MRGLPPASWRCCSRWTNSTRRQSASASGTSTVCTGVAARLPGTLVHQASRLQTRNAVTVRIGHPAGVINTETRVELKGNDYIVRRETLGRTARRIMEGYVFPGAIADSGTGHGARA